MNEIAMALISGLLGVITAGLCLAALAQDRNQ